MDNLALLGGKKVKTAPYGTGNRFGDEELLQLKEALEQNTLFYWTGTKVKTLTEKFAKMYNVPYCVATSSGTAAIHTAIGAAGISEGDEVITSPITDIGTVIGILYQNAIPVFADLDPHTYNLTAETIAERITDRTKAIIVVHLAGNAADMDPIMELAKKFNLTVIEDCAQSYLCYYKGRMAGTIGHYGCFSLNDFKHISAGEGGLLITADEDAHYKAFRFADKYYNRFKGGRTRDIPCVAPNYRMNELTGAVGIAQLDKMHDICNRRTYYGDKITEGIKDIKSIYLPKVLEGCKSTYWFYMIRINPELLKCTNMQFAEALAAEGIRCTGGYIPECVYEYDLFKNKSAYVGTHSPFDLPRYTGNVSYETGICPVAEKILKTAVRIEVKEFFTEQDIEDIIKAVRKVASYFEENEIK